MSAALVLVPAGALGLAVGYYAGVNVALWHVEARPQGSPWNWRVLLGPVTYRSWERRRAGR